MAYDLEEQEQIEQLKAWWNRYGAMAMGLLTLALVIVLGWQGWGWYQNNQATQARGYFEALERAAGQPGEEAMPRIVAAMETLKTDFTKTDYAGRAALVAAQALQARGDVAGAQEALEWLSQSDHVALAPVATLRLAGLLLDEKQYEEALATLETAPPAFEGLYADRRGDIYAAQGDREQALDQWREALTTAGINQGLASALQLKIDTLGG